MKRFLFFAVAAVLFAACSKDAINEEQGIQNIVDEAPATLTVGFEDDETRIQLNEAQKTVWTNGDLVSVFYRSDANQQWQYTGETGARTGDLELVDAGEATEQINRVVVLYPYNESYLFNTETFNVQTTLPAEQTYLKDSYGLDGNIMISSDEFNQISLKSVYGWLKLQLTGNGEQIKSITVRGNSGEQMAGIVYIDSSDATTTLATAMGSAEDPEVGGAGGKLVFEDSIHKDVTLNCSYGVKLGAEATSFYIALPPQTFKNGISVYITAYNGSTMTKSTDKELIIERNHIKPMTAFVYAPTTPAIPKPANNEIWYTNGSTTYAMKPYNTDVFGANIISNLYDAEKECWVITFDGNVTTIGYEAFYAPWNTSCENLRTIILPESITSIEGNAFHMCGNLTSVTIPSSVTKIGSSAFYRCNNLTNLYIDDLVWLCSNRWSEHPIDYAENLYLNGELVTDVVIPKQVSMVRRGFGAVQCIKSITIEDGVTSIDCVLSPKNHLTHIYIPKSVTYISNGAFKGCTGTLYTDSSCMFSYYYQDNYSGTTTLVGPYIGSNFTEVVFGGNVTYIPSYTFKNCTTIEQVTLGDNLIEIANSAFAGCVNLKTVYCKPTTPPTGGSYIFNSNASDIKIYVPASDDDSIINAYKEASGWSQYKDYIFEDASL